MKVQPATQLEDGSLHMSRETVEFVRFAVTQIERALRGVGGRNGPIGDAGVRTADHINARELDTTRAILEVVGYPGQPHPDGGSTISPAMARLLRRASEDLSFALDVWHNRNLPRGKHTDFREESMLASELGCIAGKVARQTSPPTLIAA